MKNPIRCKWANYHELFIPYHDDEWGDPVHDDKLLFEMLNLEGAQAGLSWLTILQKREGYRRAFNGFDARKIAKYDNKKRAELLKNPYIVRNKLKINAVIENARAFVGTTVCYAFMQAVGMVNDHSPECYKAKKMNKRRRTKK